MFRKEVTHFDDWTYRNTCPVCGTVGVYTDRSLGNKVLIKCFSCGLRWTLPALFLLEKEVYDE